MFLTKSCENEHAIDKLLIYPISDIMHTALYYYQ